jgi:phosphatidate phosphatase APP1
LRDQLLKKVIIRRHGKTTAIRALMKNLPDRKFVLIGDSGEKDPQIYRKICRKFPDRVKALFIRNLPHRPLEQEQRRKLVEAIPSGVFGDFEKASELKALSDGLFD